MRPVSLSRTLAAAVANCICLAQTTAGAGDLLINGSLASGGVATLDVQRIVGVASAADLSAIHFTIYGTDTNGYVISETILGPTAGTTRSTTLNFLTVTRVAVDAAVGTNVTVGTTGVGASQPVPLDIYLPFGSTISVDVTGTLNYSVQVTNDDPYANPSLQNWVSYPDAAVVAKAATATGTTATAWRAARLLTNSGSGTGKMIVTQQGLIV